LDNIKGKKIYIYHGQTDTRVNPARGLHAEKVWRALGANVITNFEQPFQHCFPTENYGNNCSYSEPFIGNCNYYLAQEVLTNLVGEMKAPVETLESNYYEYTQ
jgi:hypothetical protein